MVSPTANQGFRVGAQHRHCGPKIIPSMQNAPLVVIVACQDSCICLLWQHTMNEAELRVCAALLFLMGVQVEWQGQEKLPSERHVMVSNHVSTGDLVALYKLPRRYVHLVSTALPEQVTRVSPQGPAHGNSNMQIPTVLLDMYLPFCCKNHYSTRGRKEQQKW